MAYSAKCDTSPPTKWWITGTGSVVNRLSEVMDDNAAGVEFDDDPGVYEPWTTFMTETVEDAIYLIHLDFEIGDGSTPTTLTSLNEMVYFGDSKAFAVRISATLSLGAVVGSDGVNGSYWNIDPDVETKILWGGTLNIYATHIHHRGGQYAVFYTGTLDIKNSILSGTWNISPDSQNAFWISHAYAGTINIDGLYVNNMSGFLVYKTPDTFKNVQVHKCRYGITIGNAAQVIAIGIKFTEMEWGDVNLSTSVDNQLSVVDGIFDLTGTYGIGYIGHVSGWAKDQRTINLTIVDKDGIGIVGATVLCESSDSGTASEEYDVEEFSVDTGASGVLAEQTVTAKKWTGTSETLTNYNYFKFTISEPGYETLVMDKITIDSPMDCRYELQPPGGAGARNQQIGIGVSI